MVSKKRLLIKLEMKRKQEEKNLSWPDVEVPGENLSPVGKIQLKEGNKQW